MTQTSEPTLQSLFNTGSHIFPYTLKNRLIIALYFPFGVVFLVFRFILLCTLFVVFLLLPTGYRLPSIFYRLVTPIFGIITRIIDKRTKKPNYVGKVIHLVACNHCGCFDVFPFLAAGYDPYVLVDAAFFRSSFLARQFEKIVGAVHLMREKETREIDREKVLKIVDEGGKTGRKTLLWFPEGWDSTGRVGLMLYQRFLFSLNKPVWPVALRTSIPVLPIESSLLGTSVMWEVIWLFFTPAVIFELTLMDPLERQDEETDIEFAKRTQLRTADELKIVATDFTFRHALSYRLSLMMSKIQENKIN
jgi:hypothetical protein